MDKKNPKLALQIHHQQLHGDDSLAGFLETGHDEVESVKTLALPDLAFNSIANLGIFSLLLTLLFQDDGILGRATQGRA